MRKDDSQRPELGGMDFKVDVQIILKRHKQYVMLLFAPGTTLLGGHGLQRADSQSLRPRFQDGRILIDT